MGDLVDMTVNLTFRSSVTAQKSNPIFFFDMYVHVQYQQKKIVYKHSFFCYNSIFPAVQQNSSLFQQPVFLGDIASIWCSSRKYPCSPQGGLTDIPKGEGGFRIPTF